ncbi:MAG TPA: HD domain-containing phosphohydrolase [Acidobacteriaceae bacterium]|jgi:putative nucleotidyltransferase with HDIG domain|nr:HD domain-containing phosphohydrolase [Acidobacteriaceae bacterium]
MQVDRPIALPELTSALTFALDLTEGAVPGHSLRCCLLGMRLGRALRLPDEQMTPLYYALQLKDIGCSSNASYMTQVVGGDDRAVKAVAKLTDWTSVVRSADLRTTRSLWKHVLPEASVATRVTRIAALAVRQRKNNREMIELRCERGGAIVRKLEMGEVAAQAVLRLDEHWDGSGYPGRLQGEAIPLLSRICAVAQNLDVFAMVDGQDAAIALLRKRKGTWFDPALVEMAASLHASRELWALCGREAPAEETRRAVMDLEPEGSDELRQEHVDTICEAFADVVDAKSPFTYHHSVGVARIAEALAETLQIAPEKKNLVRRAGLLHDLGKLSVPNTILEKAGPLNHEEWAVMAAHPALTRSILERVPSLLELSVVAGEHHEKLDGSGYPLGLRAADTTLESRLLALADQFAGMTERRPYDPGHPPERALDLLRKSVPRRLDAVCFEALEACVRGSGMGGAKTFEESGPGEVLESVVAMA